MKYTEKSELYSVIGMALIFSAIAGSAVFGVMSLISDEAAVYIAITVGAVMAFSIITLYLIGFSDYGSIALVFVWSLGAFFVFFFFWFVFVEGHVMGVAINLGLTLVWIPGCCIPVTKKLYGDLKIRKNGDKHN